MCERVFTQKNKILKTEEKLAATLEKKHQTGTVDR